VPKDANYLGKYIDVQIKTAGKHFLMSEPIIDSIIVRPDNVPAPLSQGQVSGLCSSQPTQDKLGLEFESMLSPSILVCSLLSSE